MERISIKKNIKEVGNFYNIDYRKRQNFLICKEVFTINQGKSAKCDRTVNKGQTGKVTKNGQ